MDEIVWRLKVDMQAFGKSWRYDADTDRWNEVGTTNHIGEMNMAKGSNPNSKENSDPYPRGFNPEHVRKQIDPETGARERHEADIAKLDRSQGSEKGGR